MYVCVGVALISVKINIQIGNIRWGELKNCLRALDDSKNHSLFFVYSVQIIDFRQQILAILFNRFKPKSYGYKMNGIVFFLCVIMNDEKRENEKKKWNERKNTNVRR